MSLAFLAFAWLLGIAAAAFSGADRAAAVAACGVLAAVSYAFRPRVQTLFLIVTGCLLIFAAQWRYDSTSIVVPPDSVSAFNDGKALQVEAMVDDEGQEGPATTVYRLQARHAQVAGQWQDVSGGLLLRTAPNTHYKYGDVLQLHGQLSTPPSFSDFDYREYLLRKGVVSIASYPQANLVAQGQGSRAKAALIDIRSGLANSLQKVLPEPQSALAQGILFGSRSAIPQSLKDDMNATGTSHLVAVSGQNVTMLAGVLIASLAWVIGRRRACWVALGGILFYALLVGLQPSVVRAAIMGAIYVMSIALGRQNSASIALALAAAVMTAIDPQVVHDVSFQLSFAAVLGLIVMSPLLLERSAALLARRPAVSALPFVPPLLDVAVMSLSAIAFTMPIAAINFHQVSVVAPLANLFAVPAFVAVALTSLAAGLAGLVLPGDNPLLVLLAWLPTAYMTFVIHAFASLPLASTQVHGITLVHAAGYYLVLFAFLALLARHRIAVLPPPAAVAPGRRPAALPAATAFAAVALSGVLVWLLLTAPGSNRLTVTFLDIGQGDAALVQAPNGSRILVDGGPSREAISEALGRRLPFDDRRIDLLVLTHPQADHMGGLPDVLRRYHVRQLLDTRYAADTALYADWRHAVADTGVTEVAAQRGEAMNLGDGVTVTVLNPPGDMNVQGTDDLNDSSIVLRLTMGGVSMLLTGDITGQAESDMLASGTNLQASVLKVAHHGSQTSSSPDFLRAVHPAIDVISVGANNPFGHPAADVVNRLRDASVFRTDENGDVTVSTDGERIWVETQRTIVEP